MLHPSGRRVEAKTKKFLSFIAIFSLIANLFLSNSFILPKNVAPAQAQDLCPVAVDAVLVMDVSGSMADGGSESKCEWEQYGYTTSTDTWAFKDYIEQGISQNDCNNICLNPDTCHTPVYTLGTSSKIDSAKDAANNFLDSMGDGDQSALVSFSDSATLVQNLSNDHSATKSAIDALTLSGATNIGGAIEAGIGELDSLRANPQAVKVMILLTDGMANKPNGDGFDENPLDVAYAQAKAIEAAGLGYKVFTIGLGLDGEINQTMLQAIADTTGAKYYHANNGSDLSEIYDSISQKVCQLYGSISGCKYKDTDGLASTTDDRVGLADWKIVLSGDFSATQFTDENGCYSFVGRSAGNYTVAEGPNLNKPQFNQIWPVGNVYEVSLAEGENVTNKDFVNYIYPTSTPPQCSNTFDDDGDGLIDILDPGCHIGDNLDNPYDPSDNDETNSNGTDNNNKILGYKYEYIDGLASTTDKVSGWVINLFGSASTTTPAATTTTNGIGYFEFANLAAGDYSLTENLVSGWTQLLPTSTMMINLVGTSTISTSNNFVNFFNSTSTEPTFQCNNGLDDDGDGKIDTADPGCHTDGNAENSTSYNPSDNNETDESSGPTAVCGNSVIETGETCDEGGLNGAVGHCNATCSGQTPNNGGGGGGGGGIISLYIHNEQVVDGGTSVALVTWFTNLPANSRVVYGVVSNQTIGFQPNYGYQWTTPLTDDAVKTTFHSVLIGGINSNTTYYFRPISADSSEVHGIELSYLKVVAENQNQTENNNQNNSGQGTGSQPSTGNNAPDYVGFGTGGPEPIAPVSGGAGDIATSTVDDGLAVGNDQNISSAENNGEVAGEQAACQSWPIWLLILLAIIYVILILINYSTKLKEKTAKWQSYYDSLFVLLLAAMPAMALWFCASWSWWLWLIVAAAYFIVLSFYFSNIKAQNYWRVNTAITLFLIMIIWIMKSCLC